MKDKHGNELPDEYYEMKNVKPYKGESAICHNCKRPLKDTQFSLRVYVGKPGTGLKGDKLQGPLCPNCSELPPSQLPSRKWFDEWW